MVKIEAKTYIKMAEIDAKIDSKFLENFNGYGQSFAKIIYFRMTI